MKTIWAIFRFVALLAALLFPQLASAGRLAPQAETRVRVSDVVVETSLKATSLCEAETRSAEAKFAAEVASRCSIGAKGGALTGPFKGPYNEGLQAGVMDSVSVRKLYHDQLDAIPGMLDRIQPKMFQARKAFDLRNQARIDARARMADRAKALEFDITDPIRTWQEQIKYAVQVRGKSGSEVWDYILESSTRSRPGVDAAAGLSRK